MWLCVGETHGSLIDNGYECPLLWRAKEKTTYACLWGAGFWLQKNRPFATKNLASGNQKNRPFATKNLASGNQKNRPFATKNLASGNQKNRPFATKNYPYSSFLNRDILGSNFLLLRNFLVVEFFFILLVQFVRFFCKFVVQILNVIIF